MIGKIFSLLFGLLPSGGGASKAAGGLSLLTVAGSIGGAALWLFGPGREWQISLNALELSGVCLGASTLLEYFRRLPPP